MPLLSIIIPSFNSLNFLQECIKSIKIQSFKDYEVIIVDAQSTDGTIAYIKTFNPPFYGISESDQGIYDAMNKGIGLSKGEWIYFLGCDDRIHDNRTLELIFQDEIEDDISLIIGKVQYEYGLQDSYLIKKNKGVFEPSWSNKLWFKSSVHHQGVFYNKNVFKSLNYTLDYKVLSDYDLNLKLFRKRVKVKSINSIVAISKTDGISKNYNWELYKEEIDLKTKHSSMVFRPFFYLLGFAKYLLKKAI